MPYSNIIFVKLFVNILDSDDRFLYQLNESQQLLYLKMLLLAGKSGNNIPKTFNFIKNTINYNHEKECFEADMQRIMKIFPKFKEGDNNYYFEKFEELHNYIPKETVKSAKKNKKETQGKSQGNPKEHQRIAPDVEVEVDKEKDNYSAKFEEIWDKYPKKAGRKEAHKHFIASVKSDVDLESINKALCNYLKSDVATKDNGKYMQYGSTWFNNWKDWVNPTPLMMGNGKGVTII